MDHRPWTSNVLFEDLNENQLNFIEPYIYEISFPPRETIMSEGDDGSFLFMIHEGSVSVFKGELKLSEIYPGNLVGLMSLIDESPRSASVFAGKDGVNGYAINKDGWQHIVLSEKASTDSIILKNYIKQQQGNVRDTNALGLNEARAKLDHERKRVMSAHFFAQMVLGMVIFTFFLDILSKMASKTQSTYVSFVLLGAYAAWSLYYVRTCGLPIEEFGLTMKNFRPALKYAAKGTLLFIALVTGIKMVMIMFYPDRFGNNLIEWPYQGNSSSMSITIIIMYSIHAIFQEFIARGCIQGGLMQLMTGKRAEWKAIVLATLMFSSFHLMMDMKYALLSIIPGLLWGYLFYKQKNIAAVCMSHILIGIVAIFLLNLMG